MAQYIELPDSYKDGRLLIGFCPKEEVGNQIVVVSWRPDLDEGVECWVDIESYWENEEHYGYTRVVEPNVFVELPSETDFE